jgi:hypothetical protein
MFLASNGRAASHGVTDRRRIAPSANIRPYCGETEAEFKIRVESIGRY